MTGKFLACIVEAAEAPDADEAERQQLRRAQAFYEEAVAAAGETLSPDEADRQAGRVVMDALDADKIRAAQLRGLSVRSRRSVLEGIAAFKERRGYTEVQALGGGGKPPKGGWIQGGAPPPPGSPHSKGAIAARALELLVENKPGLAGAPFPSIDGRYRAVRGQFDARMADLVEAFETRTGFDAPHRATLKNVVRETFGEDTGDAAAKAMAEAWTGVAEHARLMFNAAGGDIGQLDRWGMPQFHDPLEVRKAGKAAWIEATLPRLNRLAMIDRVTGLPFTEKRLAATLSQTYDSIASGGASKRQPGDKLGAGMLANQRREERFLAFKSADDWMGYQDQFGAGDPFGIMMGHLDEMARDIAQMQILGPNPDHQFQWLKDFALREAELEQVAGAEGAVERAKVYTRQAQNMLDHFVGSANVPEREWLANAGATLRSYLTGATLGSAMISDVPSAPVFGAYARAFSGLSVTGDVGNLVAHIASPEARATARRSGFILEQATDGIVRGAQDSLRLMTVGTKVDGKGLNAFARRLPAAVMRLQLLTQWTQARKRTFRLEFMGALADRRDRSLADLQAGDTEDQAFAQLLDARGFTEADWTAIRTAPLWAPASGAAFLRPAEIIAHAGEDLGHRVAEMIELQTRQAVPETTLWTRAKLLGQDKPGTFKGEFNRSWAMFRSFTLTATHVFAEDMFLRGQGGAAPLVGTAAGAAGLLAALTVSGAVSIQLREISKGNDPRDMTDGAFWGAALMQGGGLGIVGDFFYSSQSRAGKSSAMTGWGPAAAFGSDVIDATWGNATEVIGGLEDGKSLEQAVRTAHPGRDATNLLARYAPMASLWWARAAWDRAVVDQLQKVVDPDAEKSFRARARRMEKDYGQDQWWPQGQTLPERAPDLSSAVQVEP